MRNEAPEVIFSKNPKNETEINLFYLQKANCGNIFNSFDVLSENIFTISKGKIMEIFDKSFPKTLSLLLKVYIHKKIKKFGKLTKGKTPTTFNYLTSFPEVSNK